MLLSGLEQMKFLGAVLWQSRGPRSYVARETHLLYKLTGSVQYRWDGKQLITHPSDVLLITKGTRFYLDILEVGDYYAIFFDTAKPLPPQIRFFATTQSERIQELFHQAVSLWAGRNDSSYYLCQSRLYEIVGRLLMEESSAQLTKAEQESLHAATEYLNRKLFDISFSIQEMYAACGCSETYVRNAFIKVYGVPPKRYVITARIQRAKALLISDPMMQVQEVAEAVGYKDAFHFSNLFKKETGIRPKDYHAGTVK